MHILYQTRIVPEDLCTLLPKQTGPHDVPYCAPFPRHDITLCRCSFNQDRVGYKLLLDANSLRMACQHGRPGKWTPILIHDEYNESQYEAYEYIYAPVGERSWDLTQRDLLGRQEPIIRPTAGAQLD